jgi:phenylacetate-CoA ligase
MPAAKNLSLLGRHLMRRNALALARTARLRRGERRTAQAILAEQDTLLRDTIAAARRRLPRYRALPPLDPGADPRAWLRAHAPVISKSDLVNAPGEYYPHGGRRWPWWPLGKTSGTSGSPLEVFRSIDSVVWEEAFHLQFWEWAGWRPGQPQAVLRGDQIKPIRDTAPPYWLWDRFGRQLFLSTRHMNNGTAGAMLDAIAAAGVRQLRGYPSSVYELARHAERLNHPLRLQAVITGSEPLFAGQREQVERSFGCRIADFYGMAERIAFAAQCEHGHYHLHPDYSYVEILDEHNVPTMEFGNIVGTTLRNLAMPMLRYRIADRARWLPGDCPCGRRYPRIELSSGKVEDQLFDRDGNPVSASIITFALKGLDAIEKSQVAQTGPGEWVVRIVAGPGYDVHSPERMRQNFATYVSQNLDLRIQLVADIPLQASGKFKWVSQEWPGARALQP